MTRLLVALLLLAGACSESGYSGPRYTSSEDGISFARLSGWQITRERATVLLRRPGGPATIAIRTVPRESGDSPRTRANVVPAVETTLRALPGAQVTGPTELDSSGYDAVAFDVDFAPPGRGHYQRRHVTIVADTHVIHVFLVAPAGQLVASRRYLDIVIKSIREEG